MFAQENLRDWNQWRGPDRNGSIQSTFQWYGLPEEGLKATWISNDEIASGNQGGWASPIISAGKVYQFVHEKKKLDGEWTFTEIVHCWDLDSGKEIWQFKRESSETRFPQSSTPIVDDKHLYYVGADRTIVAVNLQDGNETWIHRVDGESDGQAFHGSPARVGRLLVVALDQLVALDSEDGTTEWQLDGENSPAEHVSPLVVETDDGDRLVLYRAIDDTLRCVESQSSESIWSLPVGPGRATPVLKNDVLVVYGSNRQNGLAAYEWQGRRLPQEIWQNKSVAETASSPVVLRDQVVVQSGRRLVATQLESGDLEWEATLSVSRPRYSSPITVGDVLLYAFEELVIISPELRLQAVESQKIDAVKLRINSLGVAQLEKKLAEEMKAKTKGTAQDPIDAKRLFDQAWRIEVEEGGPLPCCSPAFADGRLVIRLTSRVVCFDLRKSIGK